MLQHGADLLLYRYVSSSGLCWVRWEQAGGIAPHETRAWSAAEAQRAAAEQARPGVLEHCAPAPELLMGRHEEQLASSWRSRMPDPL